MARASTSQAHPCTDRGSAIILLTARADVEDRIKRRQAGADDYLTKPFSPQELALRAQALLRRSFPEDDARQTLGELGVNMDFLEATWRGRKLNISATEVRLLATLVSSRRRCSDSPPVT